MCCFFCCLSSSLLGYIVQSLPVLGSVDECNDLIYYVNDFGRFPLLKAKHCYIENTVHTVTEIVDASCAIF